MPIGSGSGAVESINKKGCLPSGRFDFTHVRAEPVESVATSMDKGVVEEEKTTFEDEAFEAAKKFEAEFNSSKMDTMIHRFPPGLGEIISSRYPYMVVPRFVAIGPYHRGKKHLEKMEAVKKAAAHYLLQRCEKLAADDVRNKFLAVGENGLSVVDEARAKYFADQTVTGKGMAMDNAQFADMMICDACFLLLYMDACNRSYGKGTHDHKVNPSMRRFLFSNRDSIDNDIMLLENQLPWRVIQVLIDLGSDLQEALGKFIAGMGSSFKIRETSSPGTYRLEDEHPPPHLLALLHRHKTKNPADKIGSAQAGGSSTSVVVVLPSSSHDDVENSSNQLPTPSNSLLDPLTTHQAPPTPPPQAGNRQEVVVSAISPTHLREIGIELAASKTAAFSDMGLKKGPVWSRLTLAPLSLGDARASCLVNMAAFEVCTASRFGDPPERTAVCSYLSLLAFFMARSDDVSRLRSMSLLNGPESDDDMLAFFKTLMKHLPDYGTHFAHVMRDIEEYRNKRRIRTAVYKWLYHNYVTIIKVATVLGTLIGLYRGFLALVHKN